MKAADIKEPIVLGDNSDMPFDDEWARSEADRLFLPPAIDSQVAIQRIYDQSYWCRGASGCDLSNEAQSRLINYGLLARSGSARQAYDLGEAYLRGFGCVPRLDLAFPLILQAAEADCAEAQATLAACFLNGLGTEANDTLAVFWYRRHAESILGSYKQAFLKSLEKAHFGEHSAFCTVGRTYVERGRSTADMSAGFAWLKKAAEAGEHAAYEPLAMCYFLGRGVEKDGIKGAHWFSEREAHKRDSFRELRDDLDTAHTSTIGSDDGDSDETFRALLEFDGTAALEEMRENVFPTLCSRVQHQDTPTAYWQTALFLLAGIGTERNGAEAIRILEVAANRGSARSCYELGICYLNGHGVAANEQQALLWFDRISQTSIPDWEWDDVLAETTYYQNV